LDGIPNYGPVPPSGGSLEIGNGDVELPIICEFSVPPSGGSLEIGNRFLGFGYVLGFA